MSDLPQEHHTPKPITLENLWNGVEDVILGSTLFRTLDAVARRDLVLRGSVILIPSGQVILREGEQGDDFYLIDQGVVEVTTHAHGDSSVLLSTLQRGAFFGEVSMLTGMPRTATVTALTDVCVIRFAKNDINDVLDKNPETRRLLEAMVEGRARDAAEKVARAMHADTEK